MKLFKHGLTVPSPYERDQLKIEKISATASLIMMQALNDTSLYRKNQHTQETKICTKNSKICPYIFTHI